MDRRRVGRLAVEGLSATESPRSSPQAGGSRFSRWTLLDCPPMSAKLYTKDIAITVTPFDSFLKRNRWKAASEQVDTPYAPGTWAMRSESFTAYGPTPEAAVEKLKKATPST